MVTEQKEELRRILSDSEFTEYAQQGKEESQNLLLYWLERLLDALSDMFPQLELTGSSEDALSYGLIVLGLLVLLVLSGFLLRVVWVERRLRQRIAAHTEAELAQSPEETLGRASAAADAGNLREATRLLFLALLLGLERRGLLRAAPWKTNWEYAEELGEQGGAWVPLFRASAFRFDTVWYGGREIGDEEFAAWQGEVAAVVADRPGGAS